MSQPLPPLSLLQTPNLPTLSPKPKKVRTTFLSLPRELRQRILINATNAYVPLSVLIETMKVSCPPRIRNTDLTWIKTRPTFPAIFDAAYTDDDDAKSRFNFEFELAKSLEFEFILDALVLEANVLGRVHGVVKVDMGFVAEQWTKQLKEYTEEMHEALDEWAWGLGDDEPDDESESAKYLRMSLEWDEEDESDYESSRDEDDVDDEEDEVQYEPSENEEDEEIGHDESVSEDETTKESEGVEVAAEEHIGSDTVVIAGEKHAAEGDGKLEVQAMKRQKMI